MVKSPKICDLLHIFQSWIGLWSQFWSPGCMIALWCDNAVVNNLVIEKSGLLIKYVCRTLNLMVTGTNMTVATSLICHSLHVSDVVTTLQNLLSLCHSNYNPCSHCHFVTYQVLENLWCSAVKCKSVSKTCSQTQKVIFMGQRSPVAITT